MSAWAIRCRLVLGQFATADKSNQITAIAYRLRCWSYPTVWLLSMR